MNFAEVDQSYSEAREQDNLFLTKDVTPQDIAVTIRLLTVSEFENERISQGWNVSDGDLNRIAEIQVPADCKQLLIMRKIMLITF